MIEQAKVATRLALRYASEGAVVSPSDQYGRTVSAVLTALDALHEEEHGALEAALLAADTLLMFASRNVTDTALAARIDAACDAVYGCRGRKCS